MFYHMIVVQYCAHVTWKRSDWHARNPGWLSQQSLRKFSIAFPRQRVGSGNDTTLTS